MHRFMKWTGVGALLLTTSVLAQPTPDVDAEVGFRKGSQLTPDEQLNQSAAYMAKMRSTLHASDRLMDQARRDKDIIKLNCIRDKQNQIKGVLHVAEHRREALRMACARNDEGERNHEFAQLTIMYQKVVVLGQEAEACIGEEISYVGRPRVDIDVDKDIPQGDPTVTPPPPLVVVRPPLASPFL